VFEQALQALGYGLCHQLPERSFFGGGVQVPVCARDTGIYLGFVVGFAVLWLTTRGRRPSGFPSATGWVVVALFIGSMVVDGVSSYGSWRTTTNLIRLFTGTAAGFGVAAIVYPLLNSELWADRNPERVLTPMWRLAIWALAMPLTVALTWWLGPLLGIAYPVLVSVAIVFTFVTVNMAFAALLPAYDRSAHSVRDLAVPIAIGCVLTVVEIAGAALLRYGLDGLASRLG
jgi:uncharacterized membrane protein